MSRRFLRFACAVALGWAAVAGVAPDRSAAARAAPAPEPAGAISPADFARVDVAHARTSIYIGTVSMTMPTFERRDGRYEAAYVAKVFPYFFYNEHGVLAIDVPDAALARLAAGEAVEFSGRAKNSAGEERRIAGKATPADARSGKLKVRVSVTPRIELIFNTTYRFPSPPPPSPAPPPATAP